MKIVSRKSIVVSSLILTIFFSAFFEVTSAVAKSKWSRYRTPITIGGGTLAGAGIGGLAGGKKGAVIGGISGAAGSSVFEIVRRNKEKKRRERAYYRSHRNRSY